MVRSTRGLRAPVTRRGPHAVEGRDQRDLDPRGLDRGDRWSVGCVLARRASRLRPSGPRLRVRRRVTQPQVSPNASGIAWFDLIRQLDKTGFVGNDILQLPSLLHAPHSKQTQPVSQQNRRNRQ